MARPALLIGLGGTGQWVLTYVKKALLEYTKGKGMPPEVKLVAFDTARPIDEASRKPDEEEAVVVEGVRLDVGEFYHLGGNIEKIVREIAKERKHEHIGSWLQAKSYLVRLAAGQYALEEGAGQMRPFGRMAVFKDLESNPERSTIFGTLRDNIAEIRGKVTGDQMLEISIVASLAGGTGAGMAIDVAHLVRTIAEDAIGSKKFAIRGFFILPRAFHRIPGGDSGSMRARAFAAIRELSRFLTVFGDRSYPMIYNTHPSFKQKFQKTVDSRLFELCYLIDAHREHNSLDDVEAKYGVFPSIADAILAFLDERSGKVHTEHVNNMMKEMGRGDDVAYFSALGTFSYSLPIRDIAEENACDLTIEFLEKLVKPTKDDEDRVTGLDSASNREMENRRGADVAESFMKEPGSLEGAGGTLLLSDVAQVVDQGGLRSDTLIEQFANRSNLDWIRMIEPDDTAPDIIELREEVKSILEHSLRKDVKSSKERKVNPEGDVGRIEREVDQYRTQYLGRETNGVTSGGKYREALDRYAEIQTKKFGRGLGEFCIRMLNGVSEVEPELSKCGKLGFVHEFVSTIALRLDKFCQFMDAVRKVRSQASRMRLQKEQVQAARVRMIEDRKKTGFFQKGAASSQEEYLDLMEEMIELEKDELLFIYVDKISQQLREHAIALRDVLNKWAHTLAISTADQASVYAALSDVRQKVRARRAHTTNFERINAEESDNEFESRLYKRFADEKLHEVFRSVVWKLSEDGKALDLSVFGNPLMYEKRRDRDRPIEHNVTLLLEKMRNAFQSLVDTESIGKRLMDKYATKELATQLYDLGSPLISFHTDPTYGQPSNFLTVQYGVTEGDEAYFQDVVSKLGDMSGAKGQQAQLVQSDGAHKCSLVYTVDVVNADSMNAYDDLYEAYSTNPDDRRLLHNFPAEVNAVDYEQRNVEKLRNDYRMFHPRIVFMLEYKDWVRLFTRCMVYNFVQIERDEDKYPFYVLNLPECKYRGAEFSAEMIELTPHAEEGKPNLLDAMDTFVFRRKDFRQHLNIPIHLEHVRGALLQAEKKVGDDAANIRLLEAAYKEGDVKKFKDSKIRYEQDLGDLMHLMLLDEVDRLSVGQ